MNLKKSKPLFFENSVVPALLSALAPIEIGAIIIGPFVFAREHLQKKRKLTKRFIGNNISKLVLLDFLFYIFYFI